MSRLYSVMESVDAVFCSMDRVSHAAALGVKRICKSRSKPFVPLRNSSLSTLAGGLVARWSPTSAIRRHPAIDEGHFGRSFNEEPRYPSSKTSPCGEHRRTREAECSGGPASLSHE